MKRNIFFKLFISLIYFQVDFKNDFHLIEGTINVWRTQFVKDIEAGLFIIYEKHSWRFSNIIFCWETNMI